MQIEVMAVEISLRRWLEDPERPRRECIPSASWKFDPLADQPYTQKEIDSKKSFLRSCAPAAFQRLFPREADSEG